MANPIFNNSPVFQDPVQRKGQKSPASTVSYGTPGPQVADAATLDQMYAAPAATTRETGRLTYDDVIMKTAGLLAVLVVDRCSHLGARARSVDLRRDRRPRARPGQRVQEGAEPAADPALRRGAGCVPRWHQPVRTSRSTTASSARRSSRRSRCSRSRSFLFKSGKVRVTPKFQRTLLIAMVGYLAVLADQPRPHAVRGRRRHVRPAAVRVDRRAPSASSPSCSRPRCSSSTSTPSSAVSRPVSRPSSRGRRPSASS